MPLRKHKTGSNTTGCWHDFASLTVFLPFVAIRKIQIDEIAFNCGANRVALEHKLNGTPTLYSTKKNAFQVVRVSVSDTGGRVVGSYEGVGCL